MSNINSFKKILKREIIRIGERKTLFILSLVFPVILFVLLALIYENKLSRDLPVAIFDEDRSEITRLISNSIDATASMKIVSQVQSLEEIKNEFRNGKIQGAIYFPKNMEIQLKKGKFANVVIYKNSLNLIVGTLIYKDAVTVVRTVSSGILLKKLRSKGFTEKAAMNIVNPIRIESNSLYNPYYNYSNYLIPGLVTAMLQMIVMITGVLIFGSEIHENTFDELLKLSKHNIVILISGKILPHLLIHSATAFGILGLLFPVFSIPVFGNIFYTIIFILYFVLTSLLFSILISLAAKKLMFSTEIVLFLNTAAFIFSGFTFPLWAMPKFHNLFAQLIPYTHFLNGFIKLYQMNSPLKFVIPDLLNLTVFFVISFFGSIILLNKYFPKNILAEEKAL